MALRSKKQPNDERENKVIEISAQMQGSLKFTDAINLKINGEFNGSLEAKGTLTIGSSADVQADIIGDNIIIAGKVKGDVSANVMLVLMPTAVLMGDINTPKLNIVEGAVFQGRCIMTESLLSIDELAKYLEIDLAEIEQLANSGKIPATKKGDSWQFDKTQIDQWASSGALN